MLKRLSEVIIKVVVYKTKENKTEEVYISSSVIIKILKLKYYIKLEKSLWRLKPKEWLNNEIINIYLKLL